MALHASTRDGRSAGVSASVDRGLLLLVGQEAETRDDALRPLGDDAHDQLGTRRGPRTRRWADAISLSPSTRSTLISRPKPGGWAYRR